MNHEQKRIIIQRILHSDARGSDPHTTGRSSIFPANSWITIALLIPVVIVMTMVGFSFCSIYGFTSGSRNSYWDQILVVTPKISASQSHDSPNQLSGRRLERHNTDPAF